MLVSDTGIEVWTTMNVQYIEARPSEVVDNQPKERILIHITANPSTAMLIRRGRRVAYLHADCTALFVHETPELSQLSAEERQGFLIPTIVIGYGFVIPRSPIAGINQFTIGFGSACWVGRLPTGREFASLCAEMRGVTRVNVPKRRHAY